MGKSSLVLQYTHSYFPEGLYDPRLEDVYTRQKNVDGEHYILDILDTASADEFFERWDAHIASTDAIILAYKVTCKDSYDAVNVYYQKLVRGRSQGHILPLVLVATQCDNEHERQVSYLDGQGLAEQIGAEGFVECSAKIMLNVEQCFLEAAQVALNAKSRHSSSMLPQEEVVQELAPRQDDGQEEIVQQTAIEPARQTESSSRKSRQISHNVTETPHKKGLGCCIIV